MPEDPSFARLVILACHDLRTPLATVHGFARTLQRVADLGEPATRYVGMIDAASVQLRDLLDELGLAARIEAGRYDPDLDAVSTGELVHAAAERLGPDRVRLADDDGAAVRVDRRAAEGAVFGLANCALRHGGLETVELAATGERLTISPIVPAAAPIVLAEDVRDLGAGVAMRVVAALGGSVELDGDRLAVTFPRA